MPSGLASWRGDSKRDSTRGSSTEPPTLRVARLDDARYRSNGAIVHPREYLLVLGVRH